MYIILSDILYKQLILKIITPLKSMFVFSVHTISTGARAISGTVPDRYNPGTGPIYLDEVRCTGSESALINCSFNTLGVHNCDHNEDAGVSCEGVKVFCLFFCLNHYVHIMYTPWILMLMLIVTSLRSPPLIWSECHDNCGSSGRVNNT